MLFANGPLARQLQRVCHHTLDFIQVPGFPSAIRVFALTHSRRNVVQRYPWLISFSLDVLFFMSEIAHAATDRRMSRFLWIGLVLLCVGTGPLLIVILAAQLGLTRDPNPNPVGFGILALFTFWPSVLLIVVGIVRTLRKRRASQAR